MKAINKILLFACVAISLSACSEEGNNGGSGVAVSDLVVSFDKSVIKASGDDVVTFSAFYKGTEVTDEASFFRIEGDKYLPVSNTFSTTEVGDHSFQVAYSTGYSDIITISAISRDIPAAAVDNQAANTSFVRRTFFNQHTGAECPNCPFMTYFLRKALTDEVKDKVVLATIRNYSGENGFANIPCPGGWPYLHIDYTSTYQYNGSVEELQSKINTWTAEPAQVGISANPVYYDDGQIIVKVSVKAAQTDEYNVGLWLMQDNFKKTQKVDNDRLSLLEGTWGDSYHYHNNCVRVAESKYLGSHVGYPLGTIKAGETKEWIFLVNANIVGTSDLNSDGKIDHNDGSWWEGRAKVNLDDLHFAAFVTTHEGTKYSVVNAIDFRYNEMKSFEYK